MHFKSAYKNKIKLFHSNNSLKSTKGGKKDKEQIGSIQQYN